MPDDPKDALPDDDKPETKPDEPTGDGGKDSPTGSVDRTTLDAIRQVVQDELSKVKDALVGSKDDKPAPNRAGIESAAEEMVRKAAERITREKAHEQEHETLAQQAKKAAESAPKKVRPLTKLLWGSDE